MTTLCGMISRETTINQRPKDNDETDTAIGRRTASTVSNHIP